MTDFRGSLLLTSSCPLAISSELKEIPKLLIIHWKVQGRKSIFSTLLFLFFNLFLHHFFFDKKKDVVSFQNDHFLKVLLFLVRFSWFLFHVWLSPQESEERVGQLWGTLSAKPESGGPIACGQELSLLTFKWGEAGRGGQSLGKKLTQVPPNPSGLVWPDVQFQTRQKTKVQSCFQMVRVVGLVSLG